MYETMLSHFLYLLPSLRPHGMVKLNAIRGWLVNHPLKVLILITLFSISACSKNEVSVSIRVVDGASGKLVPSRLEVTDRHGNAHIAIDAIPPTSECFLSPLPKWLAPLQTSQSIFNPYLGTEQFYADGTAQIRLAPGTYRLRVSKGLEWKRVEQTI